MMFLTSMLVMVSLWVASPGVASPSDYDEMSPRGLITADMFRNTRQISAREFKLPPPVQISSGILRITEARPEKNSNSHPIATSRRFGRQIQMDDGVPVIEGVRVPDDPREKDIVYRNARIINNVLVTSDGELPEFNRKVTHGFDFKNTKPSSASSVSTSTIDSLSTIADLMLSDAVRSALKSTPKKDYSSSKSPVWRISSTASRPMKFRTPPPIDVKISNEIVGRSLISQPMKIIDTRINPNVRSNIERYRESQLRNPKSYRTSSSRHWTKLSDGNSRYSPSSFNSVSPTIAPYISRNESQLKSTYRISPRISSNPFGSQNNLRFSSRRGTSLAERLATSEVVVPHYSKSKKSNLFNKTNDYGTNDILVSTFKWPKIERGFRPMNKVQ